MWSYKFSMIFMLVNFWFCVSVQRLHKMALQLLTQHLPNVFVLYAYIVFTLSLSHTYTLSLCVCVCVVLPFYRKRQQYRVDLIAKIIFIYGFPFIECTVLLFRIYRLQHKYTQTHYSNIIRGASNCSFDGIS